MKDLFKKFSIKKLLICVICSVVLSTSIAYTICFFRTAYYSTLKEVVMDVELNEDYKKTSIESGSSFHNAINDTIDGITVRYGNDYPSSEVVYSYLSFESFDISFYLSSIIIGIISGMVIYIVFIERPLPGHALIQILMCFVISIVIVKCFDLVYNLYVGSIVDNIAILSNNYSPRVSSMSVYDIVWTFLITFIVACIIYGIKIVVTKEEMENKPKKKRA